MEGRRKKKSSGKQRSDNKENDCVRKTNKRKVASGCRMQGLENEGLKENIKKNERKSQVVCKLYRIK